MKRIIKPLIVFIIGIIMGYYLNKKDYVKEILRDNYKSFQVGVYTNLDAANTFKNKYKNSIIIKDNELYRVVIAILKDDNNIYNMEKYLDNKGISYYIKDVNISNNEVKKKIKEYESVMNDNSEIVFLEVNKMIMKVYEESL